MIEKPHISKINSSINLLTPQPPPLSSTPNSHIHMHGNDILINVYLICTYCHFDILICDLCVFDIPHVITGQLQQSDT